MDIRDDWLGAMGAYFGGLEPYFARSSMDANRIETIAHYAMLSEEIRCPKYYNLNK